MHYCVWCKQCHKRRGTFSNDKSYWRKVMDGDESEDEENEDHWKNDYPDEVS